jgi:hypothetical protein
MKQMRNGAVREDELHLTTAVYRDGKWSFTPGPTIYDLSPEEIRQRASFWEWASRAHPGLFSEWEAEHRVVVTTDGDEESPQQ